MLSFRWDCEQTPQVWANCADVRVVDAADEKGAQASAAMVEVQAEEEADEADDDARDA